jgi:hypothetical protein
MEKQLVIAEKQSTVPTNPLGLAWWDKNAGQVE